MGPVHEEWLIHRVAMPALRSCSALVIRCFKSVEAFADWLTGAAGFWFVCICWALTGVGGFAFCEFRGISKGWC